MNCRNVLRTMVASFVLILGAVEICGSPDGVGRLCTESYHESDCLDVALFVLKSMPFEWATKREFERLWGAISDLNGQVGRLRGELKRR
jgi:hypothetical protein